MVVSPSDADLESVCVIDAKEGVAVGHEQNDVRGLEGLAKQDGERLHVGFFVREMVRRGARYRSTLRRAPCGHTNFWTAFSIFERKDSSVTSTPRSQRLSAD